MKNVKCRVKKRKEESTIHKKQFLRSLILLLGLVVAAILVVWSNLWERVNTNVPILLGSPQEPSETITSAVTYEQTFDSIGSFNRIELQFKTFDRENLLHTIVELKDNETGTVLSTWNLDNHSIDEKKMTQLPLEETVKKGVYKLKVSSDNSDPETAIAIYLQDDGKYEGELTIGEEKQEKDISISLYKQTNSGYIRLIIIMIVSIIMAWVGYLLFMVFKAELWKSTFILLMGFGCIYMGIFPAGSTNDAWRHYVTTYEYCNQLLGITHSPRGTVMMRQDDATALSRYHFTREYTKGNSLGSPDKVRYEAEIDGFSLSCIDDTLVDSGRKEIGTGSLDTYIVSYFPATIGLLLGRVLSLGTIPCTILARFFALLSVAILVSAAVKITPVGKEIIFLLSLLPIFLQQASGFSYDGLAFGFAFLFIALCMKVKMQTYSISITDYILMLLSTIGLCACRMGMYAILICLLLVIPSRIMKKRYKIFLIFVGITTVLVTYGGKYLGTASETTGDEAMLNLGSPIHHPIKVGLLFISSIVENIDTYWGGIFGVRMGWSEVIPPYFCAFIFALLLLVVSLSKDGTPSLEQRSRIIYLIPPLFILAFCLLAMYVGENKHATEWNIWGVQGRYFIPVLPLVFFQIQNQWVVLKKNICPAIMSIFCGWEVVEIFYLMRAYLIR